MSFKTTLTEEDIRQIARLHFNSLNNGLLASFGENFLYLLYQQIYAAEGSVIIASHNNSVVTGFIAGGISIKNIYINLLKHPLKLMIAVFPKLLVYETLTRVFSMLSRRKNSKHIISDAELYSVCVLEECKGLGLGTKLYEELCIYFRKNGVDNFVIVVGTKLKRAQHFYKKKGASLIGVIDQGRGKSSHIYRQEL